LTQATELADDADGRCSATLYREEIAFRVPRGPWRIDSVAIRGKQQMSVWSVRSPAAETLACQAAFVGVSSRFEVDVRGG
jgi:hypothetical protein